jgi:hypothetical protein
VAFALAWSALSLWVFFSLHRQPDYHQRYARFFFQEAPRVQAFYAGRDVRLLSFDDGIVAYSTGLPTMAAGGYVLDAEGMRALRDHHLLELATLRGYNRVTSLVYMDEAVRALELRGPSAPARRYVQRVFPEDPLERYRFTVEYLSQAHDFAIVRVDAFR